LVLRVGQRLGKPMVSNLEHVILLLSVTFLHHFVVHTLRAFKHTCLVSRAEVVAYKVEIAV